MSEMIIARKIKGKVERYDLFSSLVDANEESIANGQPKMPDSELIGLNHFIHIMQFSMY
jgi:hypothetical protein